MKERNLRKALGMSQAEYAIFLKVSESLVSLEEIGMRSYPPPTITKETNLYTKFIEAEKAMPPLNNENYLASIRTLVGTENSVETDYQKWKEDLKMEQKILSSKLFKLGRKRKKMWDQLEISWKAFLFLEANLSDFADEGERLILDAARYNNKSKMEAFCLRLNQIDFGLAKLNATLGEINKWLEKNWV